MLSLVVMFVLLFSLVYTPGVKVEISAALADPAGVIKITRNKEMVFQEPLTSRRIAQTAQCD